MFEQSQRQFASLTMLNPPQRNVTCKTIDYQHKRTVWGVRYVTPAGFCERGRIRVESSNNLVPYSFSGGDNGTNFIVNKGKASAAARFISASD
jgi:hypothetical protein